VVLVMEKKNQAEFDQWIKKKEYTIDEKTIGFLNRRVDKKQWTIADCKMWISRIKKDFLPLVKNPEMLSSHYQITELINDNLFIAVNHKGEYGLIDKDYTIKEPFRYTYIRRENDFEYHAYPNFSYHEFVALSPFDYGN